MEIESEMESESTPTSSRGTDGALKSVNVWSYDQTLHLINSMENNVKDLNNPKKRKFVFEHVTNDLISHGYTLSVQSVQNKWKSLTRSYSKAKDNKNLSGRGPTRFLFFDALENILGEKPTNACNHSINSIVKRVDKKIPESNCVEAEAETSGPPIIIEENEAPTVKNKMGSNKLKKEYLEMKKEEYKKKDLRHKEKMAIEKERLEIDKRKMSLLEKLLNK